MCCGGIKCRLHYLRIYLFLILRSARASYRMVPTSFFKHCFGKHVVSETKISIQLNFPEWLFPLQIPARLTLSRPKCSSLRSNKLVLSQDKCMSYIPDMNEGVGRSGNGQHLVSAPASTARPRIRQPNHLKLDC